MANKSVGATVKHWHESGNVIDGLHLIIDGHVKDPEKSFSRSNLECMMLRMVEVLEMDLIWGPEFKQVEIDPRKLTGDSFKDEGGISGVCMISTSHISVHAWPLRQFVHLDIFSCKTFDEGKAMKVIHEFLNPDAVRAQSIVRGERYLLPVCDPQFREWEDVNATPNATP